MTSSTSPDGNDKLATAVGQYVLNEVSLGKAAESAGMSRWEFEEVLEESGSDALYGPRTDDDLRDELDVARNLDE
jgi:predicted HTH domain antitoxin